MSTAERHTIVRRGRLFGPLEDALSAAYNVVASEPNSDGGEPGSRDAAVLVTSARNRIDGPLMDAYPRLGAVTNFGVGFDNVDLAAAAERGIVVSNTPDVLTDAVADLAFGALLDVARSLSAADRYVRAGRWASEGDFGLSTHVSGKKLGIVGLGRIGSAVARRAAGFSMPVHYHARHEVPGSAHTFHASLADLAREVDFLVVTASGGPGTRHLVDAGVLEALGPDGFLVNVSRGSVVDEDALVHAVRSGSVAGAALDVYAREPHAPEELFRHDNVVLLPHISSSTRETRHAMSELVQRNVASFLEHGALVTPVTLPSEPAPAR